MRRAQAGFTLIEVMVAVALLGASLVVMFGFHSQAVRSNLNARRLTDCTYLAQSELERLQARDWMDDTRDPEMMPGAITDASVLSATDDLEWPLAITEVNAANQSTDTLGPVSYRLSWDIEDMNAEGTWFRFRVRCAYRDALLDQWHATTISGYRYRDW
jgi:prepilin-type N-terminal cleavage/methylation domain-containing protein